MPHFAVTAGIDVTSLLWGRTGDFSADDIFRLSYLAVVVVLVVVCAVGHWLLPLRLEFLASEYVVEWGLYIVASPPPPITLQARSIRAADAARL